MILKEQKKCAVVLLITGTVMFLTTWLTEDSHGFDFLNGLGCGLFFAGALRLLRIYRIGRDSQKAADYDIYVKDERTAYIASRARNLTFFICIYGQLIAGIGVILFLKQPLLGKTLCLLSGLQSLLYSICFWYYNHCY